MCADAVRLTAHADREVVDLLFFPTGGGKTEAYLGLAAFTLVLRRLKNPGLSAAGVAVLMRYTLRLLTLDQLSRAAALICALDQAPREWTSAERELMRSLADAASRARLLSGSPAREPDVATDIGPRLLPSGPPSESEALLRFF